MARPTRAGTTDPRILLLVDNLDRAYRGPSWHGTALRGTLRGVTPAQALWRPAGARNAIWDLLLHAAYWKYAIRRRLAGEARGAFPRSGANFPVRSGADDAAALRSDLKLLDEQHALLRAVVLALPPGGLEDRLGAWRTVDYAMGAAAHDLYHAGQINLLKRLHGPVRRRG
ncbi:MAG TPA: DinB family protein [Planctomycetota bacterium]|nr:DinB family protein [Planctomycetota bacterium]